jgi:hypothetical protein
MTTARFASAIIVKGHTYFFRYDSSPESFFGVFRKVLQLRLDGVITKQQADLIRAAVCAEVESVRADQSGERR